MSTASHTDGPGGLSRSLRGTAEAERLLLDLARQRTMREGIFEASARQITTAATRILGYLMQGYLLSRPIEATAAADFLRARMAG